ncbi:MAG TPA: PEP-CTERM sorting domain-containing protein [Lacipirellulaceae bacterium]|nr:PEP-CTERM sorting domain-containing protein [Lacipirellulaceae bacterium]
MFILYENSAEGTLGNPTGEHAFFFDNLRITVIPEPSSLAIMLLTGLTLIGARFRVWQ